MQTKTIVNAIPDIINEGVLFAFILNVPISNLTSFNGLLNRGLSTSAILAKIRYGDIADRRSSAFKVNTMYDNANEAEALVSLANILPLTRAHKLSRACGPAAA